MAEASVALAVFALGVAMLGVTLLVRCVQIACIREVDGNFGHFTHSRREGIYQQSRDEWEELAHLDIHGNNEERNLQPNSSGRPSSIDRARLEDGATAGFLQRDTFAILFAVMELRAGPGVISVVGRIPPTVSHSHHAMQLSVARTGGVRLDDDEHSSVLIREDTPHRLSAQDALTLLIDPESHCAQLLGSRFLKTSAVRTELPIEVDASSTAEEVLAELVPEACFVRHVDPRIADILAWFDDAQGREAWREVTLAGALERASLSESRFLHVFREHAGTTWRAALMWRRAQVAMTLALGGKSLTEAAHLAGYSDSAHLSRQFKQLFGLSPSLVLGNSRFVQGK